MLGFIIFFTMSQKKPETPVHKQSQKHDDLEEEMTF